MLASAQLGLAAISSIWRMPMRPAPATAILSFIISSYSVKLGHYHSLRDIRGPAHERFYDTSD
jgi:hypothetical protein